MKTEKISTNKKKFSMPHTYALLFGVIVICTILTWILPAGEFERVVTDTGRSVVVPGTFTVIESTPVGPFAMMQSMYAGIKDAASIIALVFLCCAGFGIVIGSGAVTAGINALIKKMGSKAKIAIIPIFMIILGAASSTFGMFEDTFPFIPLMAILAINMGYDAIVGVAIVALGIGMGYSGSGQAVVSMPIMTPLADLLGVSREVAVLAFQFGDGLSNILWPTAFASIICGLAHVKLDKWWKWFIPLFGLLFLTQAILIVIAVATGVV